MIDWACSMNEILGVGMYPSIMGNFHLLATVNYIGSTGLGNTYGDFYSILNKNDSCIFPCNLN